MHKNFLIPEKGCLFYCTNIDIVEIFHVLHDDATLLMRGCSERGKRNRPTKR